MKHLKKMMEKIEKNEVAANEKFEIWQKKTRPLIEKVLMKISEESNDLYSAINDSRVNRETVYLAFKRKSQGINLT